MPVAVRVQDFGWRHAGRKNPTLEGLALSIDQGERVLLLGESGSGKSTLLAAIAGILGDDEGEQAGQVLIDGHPSRSVRGMVGLVLQDPDSQVICSRVGDDVAFGMENLGVARADIWPRVSDALDAVGLGDDVARSMGVNPFRLRRSTTAVAALGVAAAVAVSGAIGFVGLVVPHLARRLVGATHRALLPAAAMLGALVLVAADALARTVLAPREIPLGILTALVGTPLLMWMMRRRPRPR
mgnify:CR=1 FL=1